MPELGATRMRVPTASAVLAAELRSRIVREQLPDGTPLESEAELIASTGLSRASVREAIRLLAAEGVITTQRGPGGGIRVSRPDLDVSTRSIAMLLARSGAPLRELFELRLLLEPRAAELAATAAGESDLESIRRAVADDGEHLPEMLDFHRLVARSAGNEFLAVTLEIVHSLAGWHTPLEALAEPTLDFGRRAHRRIAERIIARDGAGASAAMRTHLEAFLEELDRLHRLDEPVIRAAEWDPRP